jgi:Zn-dependent protease
MSPWEEFDERERPSGFGGNWQGARPTFDDPMSWAFPVFHVAGITVRVHLFFLVFVLATLSKAASEGPSSSVGLLPAATGLGILFTVILLHEFGHCIACRAKGGRADEILLWPLGGLASCTPPERPSAHFWTALGGPLVNIGIMAVLTPWIGLSTGQWWGVAIPNPLDLGGMLQREEVGDWPHLALLMTNYIAWTLLLFNLIPMFPLDGGRLLQAVLWKRQGYARSMRTACRSGLVGAVLIGVLALSMESTSLLAIALFGGVVCFATAKQLDRERDFLGFEPDPAELAAMEGFEEEPDDVGGEAGSPRETGMTTKGGGRRTSSRGPTNLGRGGSPDAARDAAKEKEAQAKEAEIDRILAKIAREGIASLTPKEHEILKRATDERRGE